MYTFACYRKGSTLTYRIRNTTVLITLSNMLLLLTHTNCLNERYRPIAGLKVQREYYNRHLMTGRLFDIKESDALYDYDMKKCFTKVLAMSDKQLR